MAENTPRAVVVSQHYPPDRSGNASRIRDTCRHLSEEGWDITVLAPPPSFPHGRFQRSWQRETTSVADGVTVHRLWAWQPTADDPSFLSRLAYYVLFPLHALLWLVFNYRGYDAVVTSSPPIFTGLPGLVVGGIGGKPWIVDVRDLWIDAAVGLGFVSPGGLIERASRRFEQLVLRLADRVTVTTTVLGDRLTELYGVPNERIRHLPNGVDTDEYRPEGDPTEQTIVYTGNVGHAQDLESCVRAMESVTAANATLRIVGDGDLRAELERIVAERDLGDRVEFVGLLPRDEIPGVLNDATIGVAPLKQQPTLAYAVPTKAYEYMSCELPVIATGSGEIRTLIEASGGGVVVENDPEQLASAFDELLADVDRRETLGAKGREHVIERYDRRTVARRLDGILREVVGR
ncbi:glycosyltransferase family 4 protein [Halorubrum sp. DTA46]|uniref:glycosyltransferase family 4 protein n=1 Tax=Halorubrum sp. DTA46 TaxID=3402162 RepID=UPI003AAA5A8B